MTKPLKSFCKVILLTAFSIVTVCLTAACGNNTPNSSETRTSPASSNSGSMQTDNSKISLRLAHNQQPSQGYGIGTAKFVELVKQKTNDKVDIQVFDSAKLGEERDVTEGLTVGSVDICITSIGVMSNYNPELSIVNLPFLFKNTSHVEKVLQSDVLQPSLEKLSARGLVALSLYTNGFRHVETTQKQIKTINDFKGLKIRIPAVDVYKSTFEALGANPTPIPWGELYTALQTKVVDGCENNPQVLNPAKIYEVAKNLTLTNHIWEGGILLISKNKWDQFSDDIKKSLKDAAVESAIYERDIYNKGDDKAIEEMKKNNVQIFEIDKAILKEAVKPVYEDFSRKTNMGDLVERIQKMAQ